MATKTTPIGNTFQKRLKDSSVTALVIGAGPVNVMLRPNSDQYVFSGYGLSDDSFMTLFRLSILL